MGLGLGSGLGFGFGFGLATASILHERRPDEMKPLSSLSMCAGETPKLAAMLTRLRRARARARVRVRVGSSRAWFG